MAYIYLGQPYSHKNPDVMEGRYHRAMQFVAHCTRAGITIYSPVIHYHNVAKLGNLPTDAEFWREQNYNMLVEAEVLWVLKLFQWEASAGLKWEIDCAKEISLPIEYHRPLQ